MPTASRLPRVGKHRARRCPRVAAWGSVGLAKGGAIAALRNSRGLNKPRDETRRWQQVKATPKLGPQAHQKVMQVGRYDATELQGNDAGTHDQRYQEHAVRDRLGRHGEEEKARLDTALVLAGRVGKGHQEPLEEKGTAQESSVDELRFQLAFFLRILPGRPSRKAAARYADVEM